MNNSIFSIENRRYIENKILEILNTTTLMNQNTLNSPRAVGDAVQNYLEKHFMDCVPSDLITDFNSQFARRAMADFAFTDKSGNYYIVDSKTHNSGTSFNMPNITSVERLARFYQDNKNYFCILYLSYKIHVERLLFEQCLLIPIELLDWKCLTIGALGWGQIQIANSNNIVVKTTGTRKSWMLEMCDILDMFYPKEISKINERMNYFRGIREYWEAYQE